MSKMENSHKILGKKWVLKIERNVNNNIAKFKIQ